MRRLDFLSARRKSLFAFGYSTALCGGEDALTMFNKRRRHREFYTSHTFAWQSSLIATNVDILA
jgi:hypothetical protein